MTTVVANTVGHSMSLDPEEEAFKALISTISAICKKQDISTKDDPRLLRIVDKYKSRYPNLTAEVIEREVRSATASPIQSLTIDDCRDSTAYSALTRSICGSEHGGGCSEHGAGSEAGSGRGGRGGISVVTTDGAGDTMVITHDLPSDDDYPEVRDGKGEESKKAKAKEDEKVEESCCFSFKKECKENHGYNLLTYTFLLTFIMVLTFLVSVLLTYLNYNHGAYRDWALAGGVTSTSANFRVRGPASDDGFLREFVVSKNPNLAIEKDQILNSAVSFSDFQEEEHFVKRLQMNDLTPRTQYYYGITRPKRTPNSAEVAGSVGSFTTPAPEGERFDFTIATGSCALTGSKSDVFSNILDLDPLMFIHTGDFHYEDLNTLDVDERLEAYDKVMGSESQRLLYMRTIFSYIWDDHDWLGNNQDSDYDEAVAIARQSYTLGIPHYPLGSSSTDEANAAKYQAFTIGTVRFIITDLRSESIKSSEYYQGKVYSKEQKQWLYREFARAENYDFVVWVTTRPWTDPVEAGSDSWGGFAPDRDELSAYIANVIGAGPRNLLVLSGDNHMVAFDDGSSTDYSQQTEHPGGFPLLHSGPMTNYGSGVLDFFSPKTNYFTDGCMATNSELNYQFSTVDFSFPQWDDDDSGEGGCVHIRSYSKDSSNVIFEKEICGELMKYGTEEQDTCTLEKLTVPTYSLFIAAAGLILLQGISALLFLGLNKGHLAMSYFGIGCLYYLMTIGAAIAGAFCFGTLGVDMLIVAALVLAEAVLSSFFVGKAICGYCDGKDTTKQSKKSGVGGDAADANAKAIERDDKDGATHDETCDDLPLPYAMIGGGEVIPKSDARETIDTSSPETVEAVTTKTDGRGSPETGETLSETDSKAYTDNTSKTDVIERARKTIESKESADDSSASAIVFGGKTSFSDIEENLSTVSESVASLFATAKDMFSGRSVSSKDDAKIPTKSRSLDATSILADLEYGPPVAPGKEEGIEVTNPVNQTSSAFAIKVSPSLISL